MVGVIRVRCIQILSRKLHCQSIRKYIFGTYLPYTVKTGYPRNNGQFAGGIKEFFFFRRAFGERQRKKNSVCDHLSAVLVGAVSGKVIRGSGA
jgi:hypothetical protein